MCIRDRSYNTRNNSIYSKVIRLGEGFESDLGFIRRKGIFKNYFRYQRRFWLKNKKIRSVNLISSLSYTDKPQNNSLVTDRNYRVGFEFNFNSMSNIEVSLSNDFTQLEDSFNPLGDFGTNPLPANSDYNYSYLEFEYRNDQRKKLSYGFEFNNGYPWLLFALILFYAGSTIKDVPYSAWGAELSTQYNERTLVMSWREGFSVAGSLIGALTPAIIVFFRLYQTYRCRLFSINLYRDR